MRTTTWTIRASLWCLLSLLPLVTTGGVTTAGELKRETSATGEMGEEVIVSQDTRWKRDLVVVDQGRALWCTLQVEPSRWALMELQPDSDTWTAVHPNATTNEFEPAVSADGQWRVFVQSRGNLSLAVVFEQRDKPDTFEVPPAGGFCGYSAPAISRDGRFVVYSFAEGGRQRLIQVTPRATESRVLVEGEGINNWPDISPDGKWVAFGSSRDDDYEIYRLELASGRMDRLTKSAGSDVRPRFSPDGQRLAFVSRRDGNPELYVLDVTTRQLRRFTDNLESDDYPAWSADGQSLFWIGERDGAQRLLRKPLPR